jgi:putative holliday junction resolvase
VRAGRRIAFDYGDVRIGVAISDASGLLALPLEHIQNNSDSLFNECGALLAEHEPIYIAVGFPLHMSGKTSAKSSAVEEFCSKLSRIASAPIYLIDERMTTVSAGRLLKEAGLNSRQARTEIDSQAAVAILDAALNQERIQGQPIMKYAE